ncbi:MAG: OmpH family outer membrane protein [Planctomycetota bacterium]|nr:MAG: OmpH family outer membrane protein [Planctomycetota bacterium]
MITCERKKFQLLAGFLAGAVLFGVVAYIAAGMSATSAAAGNSNQLRIGIVNLQTVMVKYERSRIFREKWETKAKEMTQSFLAQEKKISEKTRELEHTLRTTERYAQLYREIELMRRQLEFDRDFLGKQHLASGEQVQREIFAEIEAAVNNHASKEGFSAVFMAQELPEEVRDKVELSSYFQAVMYYDKSVDISDAIAERLNAAAGTQPPSKDDKEKPR